MTDKPNILILLSDQHNRKLAGCYGNELVRTPNIDKLASEGMTFSDAYCPAPLCVPSRMSFMTACQPSTVKVWTNSGILPSEVPCWTHYLGLAGYESRLIGRMHFVGADQRHGFFRDMGEIGQPVESWGIKHEGNRMNRNTVKVAGKGLSPYLWYDRQVAAATCDFLRDRAEDDNEQPFAAVAGFLAPHNPYIARADLFDYYYERVDVPDDQLAVPESIDIFKNCHGWKLEYKREQIRRSRAAYFALCEEFDEVLGTVLQCLEDTELKENTIVIYISDHGDMAGEKGCWTKGCYYEGSAGVPLIVRAPGITRAASRCSSVVNLYDLAPTLCEIAGAEAMRHVQGRSILNLLKGGDKDWKNETFSELFDVDGEIVSRMIRSGDWKLWQDVSNDVAPVLFNLAEDPEELNDLGSDPQYAGIREKLLQRLHENWDPEKIVAETAREKEQRGQYYDKTAQVLNDWSEVISRWESNCPAAADNAIIRNPVFPPGLDSPYQPPA